MKKTLTSCLIWTLLACGALRAAQPASLIDSQTPVDWWFVFKFNSGSFPASCPTAQRDCPFGGTAQAYKEFSQRFAFASSANPHLQHGFIMQVSTPDWPGSGSSRNARKTIGNTLGCISGDDDIQVSQHFFALKLNSSDVLAVLNALGNASVVTDPKNPQIVNNGGPAEIQRAVNDLGLKSASKKSTQAKLSSGVTLILKASDLDVPPWQMVSSLLGGEPLRAATCWASPEIYSTTAATAVSCWDASLTSKPGAVEIAITGTWQGKEIGLKGGLSPDGDHAKKESRWR